MVRHSARGDEGDPMATKAKTTPVPAAGCEREMMSPEKRDEALKRLARASGQVAGIGRMIDDGAGHKGQAITLLSGPPAEFGIPAR